MQLIVSACLVVALLCTVHGAALTKRSAAGWPTGHPFPESSWSDWTPCTQTCEGGYQGRHNCAYDYQIPDLSNPPFTGPAEPNCALSVAGCSLQPCEDKYDWQPFDACNATCGGGYRRRLTGPGCSQGAAPACPPQTTYHLTVKCHTQSCTKVEGCGKADIMYVLDSSGSVGDFNWFIEKQFAIDVTKALDVDSDKTRVGVVTYSTEVVLNFGLGDYDDIDEISDAIWDISWMAASTNTADGIRRARKEFKTARRDDVKKIMVVVTDGNSNIMNETTIPQADLAREDGILVFVIGIGENVNPDELLGIGNTPSDTYVYHVSDFDALPGITQTIVEGTCKPVLNCGAWSDWSNCSATCGGGFHTQTRQCTESVDGDVKRTWTETNNNTCAEDECLVPIEVCADEVAEGVCTASCGGGKQKYVSVCTTYMGTSVVGTETETTYEVCNEHACPIRRCNGWEATSDCSVTCGAGTESTARNCRWVYEDGSEGELELEQDARGCNLRACPTDSEELECSKCLYDGGDTDYLPDPTTPCKFIMCLRALQGDGTYGYQNFHMSCAPGTFWNPAIPGITCHHDTEGFCDGAVVPAPVNPGTGECPQLTAVTGNNKVYLNGGVQQPCAPGTVFDKGACGCIHGDNHVEACTGPLLYFPFDNNFASQGCQTVEAYALPSKNAVKLKWDAKKGKSAHFDGHSLLEVPFMRDFFANNNIQAFTVALYFKWVGDLGQIGGLVNNGDCETDPSFDVHVGGLGEVASASLNTDDVATGLSVSSGDFSVKRWEWVHVAEVYDGQTLKFYVNGEEKSSQPITGPIANSKCKMIIGQLGRDESSGLFKGFIDELRVYLRALDGSEISRLVGLEDV